MTTIRIDFAADEPSELQADVKDLSREYGVGIVILEPDEGAQHPRLEVTGPPERVARLRLDGGYEPGDYETISE